MHDPFRRLSPRLNFAAALQTLIAALLALAALRVQAAPSSTEPPSASKLPRFAIAVQGGTAGYGPAVVFTASRHFTASLGYTWFGYDYDFSDEDGDYNGKLKLSNVQALVNWHPFAGTFHLSAGAFLSDNEVEATGRPKPDSTYEVGDTTYTAAQIGTLSGNVKLLKGTAPFVGLGWTKSPGKTGLGFFFDIGVVFMKSPRASFTVTGPIASNPTFQADLREEEQSINDELDAFRHYPIVQVGLLYRF